MNKQVNFTTTTITIIFKDGTTATFENAITWNKNIDYYDIFFVCYSDVNETIPKILYAKYMVEDVATIIGGYADILC